MLLIKNGRVVDPASKTDAALDVLLDGEKIREVGAAGKIWMQVHVVRAGHMGSAGAGENRAGNTDSLRLSHRRGAGRRGRHHDAARTNGAAE